ncbi:hypothetical protein ONS96_002508 [Cadophora gregata f. sp. sojae]|nr:hypothetical protein ONS96_002508 [Cadophora gregata f. sp. sojae]
MTPSEPLIRAMDVKSIDSRWGPTASKKKTFALLVASSLDSAPIPRLHARNWRIIPRIWLHQELYVAVYCRKWNDFSTSQMRCADLPAKNLLARSTAEYRRTVYFHMRNSYISSP